MYSSYDPVGPNDLMPTRTLVLDNGNEVNVKKEPVYGFWTIHMKHGQVPDKLTGHYTSFEDAKRALLRHVWDRKREVLQTKTISADF